MPLSTRPHLGPSDADAPSEFRDFVRQTEQELRILFDGIDRDRNGQLDKAELRGAFARAGLGVSNAKLDRFFAEVDVDRDGVISFDEWRCVPASAFFIACCFWPPWLNTCSLAAVPLGISFSSFPSTDRA